MLFASAEDTAAHMSAPQPGDLYHEMLAFCFRVEAVSRHGWVRVFDTHFGMKTFLSVDAFMRRYAYGGDPAKGYPVRYGGCYPQSIGAGNPYREDRKAWNEVRDDG